MKIKDILTNTFGYTPKDSYQFSLSDNHEKNTNFLKILQKTLEHYLI